MRFHLFFIVCALTMVAAVPDANARKMCFGQDEELRTIQKVDVKSPEGEPLSLARKIRMDCFVLPYTITDEGFVLAKDDDKTYYSLTDDQITDYQKQGTLPLPLPDFELSTIDYVLGHALWLVLIFIVGWGLIDWLRDSGDDNEADAS